MYGKPRIALVGSFVLGLIASPLQAQVPDEVLAKLREYYSTGQKAFDEGKYDDAAQNMLKFIEILPKEKDFDQYRAYAHYYAACSYSKLDRTDDALKHLGTAMESGFRDFDTIEGDTDLAAIKDSGEFKALLAKYRKIEEERLQKFDFALTTLDGKPIAKKDFLGKVLVVDVWGTWCPPCKKEVPHFVELMKKYREKGLQIVGLNWEERVSPDKERQVEIVKKFIEDNDVNYPCALVTDEVLETIPDFGAFPTTLFIDHRGAVRKKLVGYHSYEDLEEIVKPLLAEAAGKKDDKESGEKKEG